MISNVLRRVRSRQAVRWLTILTILIMLTVLCTSHLVLAASSKFDINSRMVTIYDGLNEKTIITKSKTVHDALDDAMIHVNDYDKVEPSLDSKLDDSMTVVNIKRAHPVTVVDGLQRTRIMTASTDESVIAKEAGAGLKSNDTVETSQINDFVAQGGAGVEMSITRAKSVHIVLYGQKVTLRTQKSTVRQMLNEAKIELSKDDTASIPLDASIVDGLSFQIWRNGIQTIEQQEDVPFETQTINDDTKKVGFHEVQTAGQIGKKTVIYQVNMQNGQEVGRQKISEVVTIQPVTQIEINGTKVELPPGSHSDWMAMAGIPESDWGAANYIISRESGWRYNAQNGSSGAYGLPQALPGSKMASAGSDWKTNPITQLKWFYSYCKSRYGSIQGAYNYWQQHHSY